MKKYYGIILLVFVMVLYHKRFFGLDIIAHGDWGYLVNLISGHFDPFTWRFAFSMGGVLLDMTQFSWFLYSLLGNLGFNYEISERMIFLWPYVFLTVVGYYKLGKKILGSHAAGIITSIVLFFNTYNLTLTTGHVTLAVSFSVFPWILISLINYFKKNDFKYLLYTILWFMLALGYEPRAAYILALILILYLIFNLRNFKTATIKHLIFGFFVLVLINLRRYLPLSHSLGNISDNEIFNRGLFGSGFFNLMYSFVLHHPFRSGGTIEVFKNQSIPFYFWIIPIIAFVGAYLNSKNRNIQFFIVITLLGILLSKQSSEPFSGIYLWLYNNFPGFNAFREASKFYFLIALGYSVLIGGFVSHLERNKKINIYIRYGLVVMIAGLFLYNAKPIVNQEIGTLFVGRNMPQDYQVLNEFLLSSKEYGRTLSVPRDSRWMFYGNRLPKISLVDELSKTYRDVGFTGVNTLDQITSIFALNDINKILDYSSIKYVILPLVDFDNDDDFYLDYGNPYDDPRNNSNLKESDIKLQTKSRSKKLYGEYYDILSSTESLKEINIGTKQVKIFENLGYRQLLSADNVIKYKFLNPTKYSLNLTIPANSTGEQLSFLQSYHDEWKLYPGRPINMGSCEDIVYYSGSSAQIDTPQTLSYTVQPGENLRSISEERGYDYDEILQLNPYVSPTPRAGAQIDLIVPMSGDVLTGDTEDLTWGPTSECVRDGYSFFQGEELSYLWHQPLRDDTHKMVYDYANAWNIGFAGSTGQDILQRGLREGRITENPDGSYDVALTLYFRPQSWFYVGLLISGTTLLGLLGWLLRSYTRPRQKSA